MEEGGQEGREGGKRERGERKVHIEREKGVRERRNRRGVGEGDGLVREKKEEGE